MTHFFSVIIPLYNKEKLIALTIKSILNQTFNDFEVIIVNDGSTDNGLKILSNLVDDRFIIYNQDNQGVSHARNFGIEKAKGKYIALLDADDFWHTNHLFELKKLIETFPNAGLFCNNYEINYNGKFVKPATFNFKYENKYLIVKDFFSANIINFIPSSSSSAFLKSTFTKLGAYNLNFRTGQDIDLWIRFALKHDIAFNPVLTMRYNNFDNSSLSKNNYNIDRYNLINGFNNEETNNISLKRYLDINRYALAIRCKMNNEIELCKKLKKEIDFKNLNFKQKMLLRFPKILLKFIKRFQRFLIENKIYLSAYN
ncbi:MAG: glycosyltransferase [Flavobacteriaceae bacterium]|nr:glycosyltransferase [Flavobacteriaceae bacterium]